MPVFDKLVAQLNSNDDVAAESAAVALAALGESAATEIQRLLHSTDPNLRWWGIRTLAGMASAQARWFVNSLQDPEPEVRAAAALALSAHPDARAIGALIAVLDDSESLVGVTAVKALVNIGPEAISPLIESYGQASAQGQLNILRALAATKDHRAIPVMMQALGSDSAALQYWANAGLERLGLDMVYMRPD